MEKRTVLFRCLSVFGELHKSYKLKGHFWSRHFESFAAVMLDTFSVISNGRPQALVLRGLTVQASKEEIIFARLGHSYLINCS